MDSWRGVDSATICLSCDRQAEARSRMRLRTGFGSVPFSPSAAATRCSAFEEIRKPELPASEIAAASVHAVSSAAEIMEWARRGWAPSLVMSRPWGVIDPCESSASSARSSSTACFQVLAGGGVSQGSESGVEEPQSAHCRTTSARSAVRISGGEEESRARSSSSDQIR